MLFLGIWNLCQRDLPIVFSLSSKLFSFNFNVYATDNGSLDHSSSYPYVAVIKYDGNWYARMGDPNYLSEQAGSGVFYHVSVPHSVSKN